MTDTNQGLVDQAKKAAEEAKTAATKTGEDVATTNNYLTEMQSLVHKNSPPLKEKQDGGKKKKTKKQWLKLKNKSMKKIMKKIKKNKSLKK